MHTGQTLIGTLKGTSHSELIIVAKYCGLMLHHLALTLECGHGGRHAGRHTKCLNV